MTDKKQKELDSMLDAALDDLDSDSDSNDDDEYNDEINQRSVQNNSNTTQNNSDSTTDEEQDEVRMAKALENVMEGLMKMNTETEGNHQSQTQQQQQGDKEDLEFSQEAFVNFIQEMQKAVSTMDEETTNQKTRAKPSNNNPDDSTTVNNDVDRTVSKILNDMAKSSNTSNNESSEEGDNGHVDYNQVFPEAAQMEQMGEELMESMMKEFGKHFASATAADEPSTSTEKNNKQKSNSASDNDIQENVLLEGMMKQLLNKEVMYDPMKQVSDRFPKWLAEHKSILSEEEYNRYGQQYQYFQRIVHVYERDPENYPRLMELMQDIQEFGQPPAEIIKELAPELEFDEEGMPKLDGMNMPFPPMMGMPSMNMPPGGVPGDEECIIM